MTISRKEGGEKKERRGKMEKRGGGEAPEPLFITGPFHTRVVLSYDAEANH
jgi:hypothetical protein